MEILQEILQGFGEIASFVQAFQNSPDILFILGWNMLDEQLLPEGVR